MNMIHSESPDNPFSSNLELKELYTNVIIDQFTSVLLNSIGGKDFLILVMGESQSGKTTLLSKLTSQIELNVKPCQLKIKNSDDASINFHKHHAFLYKTENSQVIILDDAHKLNSTELEVILKNAWESDKGNNQLILFCEPRINTIISSMLKNMPKKTSVNKLYIPCFDIEETEAYLNHYLEVANLKEKFSFSDKNVKIIYEQSKGLPGKINHAAKKNFDETGLLIKNMNKKKSKYVLIFSFLIILILLSLVVFFLNKKSEIMPASNPMKIASKDSHKSITKKIKPLNTVDQPGVKNTTQDSNTKPAEHLTINTKSKIDQPAIIEKRVQEKPSIIIDKYNIFKEKWILEQESRFFTIQIMAAKDDVAIDRFLKLNIKSNKKIAYYKMNSKSVIWYKFIYGKYKTIDHAKSAIQDLPVKLKNLRPWIRQFKSIHNEIHEFVKNNNAN